MDFSPSSPTRLSYQASPIEELWSSSVPSLVMRPSSERALSAIDEAAVLVRILLGMIDRGYPLM
jgi:hypothetical protein